MTGVNGNEVMFLTDRMARLEARQLDEDAKILAAIRELKELTVSSFKAYGEAHAHLAKEVARLYRRTTRSPPQRHKRK